MTDAKTGSTRTITLTGRQPVTIREDDWPLIASVKTWDNQYESQANRAWRLFVRQNEVDGRTLVYGVYSTQFPDEADRRGGELLTPPASSTIDGEKFAVWPEIPAAIYRVAEYLGFERRLADECIADLPAEELS